MNCLFCEDILEDDIPSLELHIRYFHSILVHQDLALRLYFLDAADIEELTPRLQQRVLQFSNLGTSFEPEVDEESPESTEVIDIWDDDVLHPDTIASKKSDLKSDLNIENVHSIEIQDFDGGGVKKDIKDPNSCVDVRNFNLVTHFRASKQCRLCYEGCPTEDDLKRHEKTAHEHDKKELNLSFITLKDLVFKCEECPGIGFLTENILKMHRKSKHQHGGQSLKLKENGSSLTKEKEDSKTRSKTSKKQDRKTREPLLRKALEPVDICKLCHREFFRKNKLQAHKQKFHKYELKFFDTETTDAELTFPCTKCNGKFISENSLKIHLQQQHHFTKFNYSDFEFLKSQCYNETLNKFQCSLCYEEIQPYATMVRHVAGWHKKEIDLLRNISSKVKSLFSCPECEKTFKTKNSKFVHRILNHYNLKGTYCNLCDVRFVNQMGALMHRKRIHKNELQALKETFSDKEKHYTCTICASKYYTEGSLNYHTKRRHTAFAYNKATNTNTNTNTVKRSSSKAEGTAYKCFICSKPMKGMKDLIEHCQNIHNTAPII